MSSRVIDSADVHPDAVVGDGTAVWHYAHVREGAQIGTNCVVGRGVYVGTGVRVGNNVKLQNYAMIYEPALIEDGVFVGPAVVLTNDSHPRAINPDGTPKSASDWDHVGVTLKRGASVGAGSVCVAPLTVGRWALVAAGSVVTKDVPDHALVAGVPAKRVGWVGEAGVPLELLQESMWRCPQTGALYRQDMSTGLLEQGG